MGAAMFDSHLVAVFYPRLIVYQCWAALGLQVGQTPLLYCIESDRVV